MIGRPLLRGTWLLATAPSPHAETVSPAGTVRPLHTNGDADSLEAYRNLGDSDVCFGCVPHAQESIIRELPLGGPSYLRGPEGPVDLVSRSRAAGFWSALPLWK